MSYDLSGLRDIHTPPPPSWFPPAMGWWFVLGCVLLLALIIGAFYLSWYMSPQQYALRELKDIYRTKKESVVMARYISVLLKRIALLTYPREKVATLTEEKWVDFLQEKTGKTFSDSQLTLLAFAAYMPDKALVPDDPTGLYHAAEQAVRLLFKEKKNGYKN